DAELVHAVSAPAARRAVGEKGAGVVPAGGDAHHASEAAHGDGRGAARGGAVAELAVVVHAPAANGAVAEAGACEAAAAGAEPALTATAPLRPWTGAGVGRPVKAPSPSWPSPFLPQQ